MTTGEKIQAYLKRIGYTGSANANAETLARLQRQHLLTVPYENLDIMRNIPLSLETDALFEKIVLRGRGGYCFELNGLFAFLLRAIGFEVTEYMSRFLRDETEIPMRRHRVLRVRCGNNDYLCDVGVGGIIPRKPLILRTGEINEQGRERYKLEREDFYGYVLYEWRHDAWSRLYAFTEEEQLNIDYVMPSYYCEKHPQSFFRTQDMVHIFTENGRKSVAGREVRLYTPSGAEIIYPSSEEEYEALLCKHFQIRLH